MRSEFGRVGRRVLLERREGRRGVVVERAENVLYMMLVFEGWIWWEGRDSGPLLEEFGEGGGLRAELRQTAREEEHLVC